MSTPRIRLVETELILSAVEETGRPVSSPEHSRQILAGFLEHWDRESVVVLHLDVRNHVLSAQRVSVGTLCMALVHPREVFKGAILANAATVICGHNHPSGVATPSEEDARVCKRLKDAGMLLGIEVMDFVIVAPVGKFYSYVQEGRL